MELKKIRTPCSYTVEIHSSRAKEELNSLYSFFLFVRRLLLLFGYWSLTILLHPFAAVTVDRRSHSSSALLLKSCCFPSASAESIRIRLRIDLVERSRLSSSRVSFFYYFLSDEWRWRRRLIIRAETWRTKRSAAASCRRLNGIGMERCCPSWWVTFHSRPEEPSNPLSRRIKEITQARGAHRRLFDWQWWWFSMS